MKNTRSEGELRQASNTPSPTFELAPPLVRGRTRSIDATAGTGARPRPVAARRLTPGSGGAAAAPAVTSVQCQLRDNAEIRYDHAVFPSATPGRPAQHRSAVTVPVGGGGLSGAVVSAGAVAAAASGGCGRGGAAVAVGNQPPPLPRVWFHQQPSLIEVDDPLQIFDGTPALLSPENARPGPRTLAGPDRSPNVKDERRLDYRQALILNQKARKGNLESRLKCDRDRLMLLKLENRRLEDLLMKRRQDRGSQFPTVKDLKALTESVHKLRVQCELTNQRIELVQNLKSRRANGEFYANMEQLGYTGQGGRVPLPEATSAALLPLFSRSIPAQVAPGTRVVPQPPPRLVAAAAAAGTDATAVVVPPDAPHHHSNCVNAGSDADEDGPQWACPMCTFLNHPALSACEQCDTLRPPSQGAAGTAVAAAGAAAAVAPNAGKIWAG